jgi:hypothetical protein
VKNLFLIIDGGLMTEPAPRGMIPCDKVVRFETPACEDRAPATPEPSFLRALDDEPGFDLDGAESPGCILDFEYNGVPARHGFIRD